MEMDVINWFPGHMTKATRMVQKQLGLVDVVVELLDARIPYSSSNPAFKDIIGNKPCVVALNKIDLADAKIANKWLEYYKNEGHRVVTIDSLEGRGLKELIKEIEKATSDKMAKLAAKNIKNRSIRAMILGIPNVGKSSLINRLSGSSIARTGNKPGVTKGQQWIKASKNLEFLDTPGILWPKFEDQTVAFKLAIVGSIRDEIFNIEKVGAALVAFLAYKYEDRLEKRYRLTLPLPTEPDEILELIAKKRGFLKSGGIADIAKAQKTVLTEFRSGKLGNFTLDDPDEIFEIQGEIKT